MAEQAATDRAMTARTKARPKRAAAFVMMDSIHGASPVFALLFYYVLRAGMDASGGFAALTK
jgi:hypothetical protein